MYIDSHPCKGVLPHVGNGILPVFSRWYVVTFTVDKHLTVRRLESEWKTYTTAESSRNLFVISHERKLSNSLFVENKKSKANLSSTTVATVVPKYLKSAKLVKQFETKSKNLLKVLIDSGSDESFLNQKHIKNGKIKG